VVIFFIPGREEHECGCFLCADSSRVHGVSCCLEHGVFMVDGMADGEPKKSGGEGVGVFPKHFVPWVLTPVMGEFGVMVKGGCHFFFSDQGPLLKGGGDVGGEYPCKRVFDFLVRMFRGRDVFTCNEAYKL